VTSVYNFTYQRASFRGAEFGVFDAEVLFGRRNVLHEYPLRDEPLAEDLGKKAREYSINAFVIGKNYSAARDALMRAIEEQNSPGTLVHPTLGSIAVIPKDCRIKFDNREGGIEYFTLTFVEAGENNFPSGFADTSFLAAKFSSDAISTLISSFADSFNVFNVPDFLHSDALTSLVGNNTTSINGDGNDFLSVVKRTLKAGSFGSDNSEFTNISDMLGKFSTETTDTLYEPVELGRKVSNILTGMSDVYLNQPTTDANAVKTYLSSVKPANPELQALEAQKRIQDYGNEFVPVPSTTADRIQQADNQYQLINLIKNISICEMIRITSIMTFASRQDAISIRENVDSYIQPQLVTMADRGEDTQYLALNKARAAMIRDINTRAATLRNKRYITTADAMPAIVFAYDQYEDATKDVLVIERNHIRNPVFIPSYSSIEVVI
jgi:Mu-like prophage DNA circulation protein